MMATTTKKTQKVQTPVPFLKPKAGPAVPVPVRSNQAGESARTGTARPVPKTVVNGRPYYEQPKPFKTADQIFAAEGRPAQVAATKLKAVQPKAAPAPAKKFKTADEIFAAEGRPAQVAAAKQKTATQVGLLADLKRIAGQVKANVKPTSSLKGSAAQERAAQVRQQSQVGAPRPMAPAQPALGPSQPKMQGVQAQQGGLGDPQALALGGQAQPAAPQAPNTSGVLPGIAGYLGLGTGQTPASAPPVSAAQAPGQPQVGQPVNSGGSVPSSGLGDNYDAMLAAGQNTYDQRQASILAALEAAGLDTKALLGEVVTPTKDEFTSPYDKLREQLSAEYDGQKGNLADFLKAQLAEIDRSYGADVSTTNNAASAANTRVGDLTNQLGQVTGAQAAQSKAQQDALVAQAKASGASPEAIAQLTARSSSALPPEVLAALTATGQQSVSSAKGESLSQAASRRSGSYNDAYNSQKTATNQLFDNGASNFINLLKGQQGSLSDFYGAQDKTTGAKGTLVNNLGKLRLDSLDKAYADSAYIKQALGDISGDRNNQRNNLQSDTNNIRTTSTQEANNIRTVGGAYDRQVLSSGTSRLNNGDTIAGADRRSAADRASREGSASYTGAGKTTAAAKPKLVKGDEWLATHLSKSPNSRTNVVKYTKSGALIAKDNGGDAVEHAKALVDADVKAGRFPKSLNPTAIKNYIEAYGRGVMEAPAQAKTTPKGSSGGGVAAAKQGYAIAKSWGIGAVDGLGVSSAAHKAKNPNSDHDTGKAFDLHAKGDQAVERAMGLPGVRYIIHNKTIYTNTGKGWTAKPYGGKFANGQAKDPHTNHIHVNF